MKGAAGVKTKQARLITSNTSGKYYCSACFCNFRQPAANFESRNLKCLLAKRCWNNFLYTDNVTDSVFFILWNIPILLVLALDLKGIINTLKRYFVAMECADVVAFTFATWECIRCMRMRMRNIKIEFTLQLWPSRIYLLLRVSLVG